MQLKCVKRASRQDTVERRDEVLGTGRQQRPYSCILSTAFLSSITCTLTEANIVHVRPRRERTGTSMACSLMIAKSLAHLPCFSIGASEERRNVLSTSQPPFETGAKAHVTSRRSPACVRQEGADPGPGTWRVFRSIYSTLVLDVVRRGAYVLSASFKASKLQVSYALYYFGHERVVNAPTTVPANCSPKSHTRAGPLSSPLC